MRKQRLKEKNKVHKLPNYERWCWGNVPIRWLAIAVGQGENDREVAHVKAAVVIPNGMTNNCCLDGIILTIR